MTNRWRAIVKGPAGFCCALVLAVLTFVPTSLAQKAPDFKALRRDNLSETDRLNVRKWIKDQISQLFAAEDPQKSAQDASNLFFGDNGLVVHFQANDTAEEFQRALAQIITEVVIEKYKAEPSNPTLRKPVPMTFALLALQQFASPSALDLFKMALADPASGIKALGAKGLLAIVKDMNNDQKSGLYEEVRKLIITENNSPAIIRLFKLLVALKGEGQSNELLPVILEILDGRLERFEQQGLFPARAEQEMTSWLVENIKNINNQQTRNDVVLRIARLLANAVYTYLNQSPVDLEKIGLMRVIESTEKQLKTFVTARPQPSITDAVLEEEKEKDREKQEEKRQKIVDELGKWIGTEQQDGLLNKSPFEFPRGLGIKRPVQTRPAAATKPASAPSG